MLVQVAMQEAATAPAPRRQGSPTVAPGGLRRSASADGLRRNPLRRSASLDGSDHSGRGGNSVGMIAMAAVGQHGGQFAAGPDGRPRSADAAAGFGGWGSSALSATHPGSAGATRGGPLRQRQQQVLQQRAAAQLQHQFIRRTAASTLQAHWRGWQHRRLARYLRARRKRGMRLDWLWHLEYVTNLLQWHEAAHTVQATWRAHRELTTLRRGTKFAGQPSRAIPTTVADQSQLQPSSGAKSGSPSSGGDADGPELSSTAGEHAVQQPTASNLASPPATADTAGAPQPAPSAGAEPANGDAAAVAAGLAKAGSTGPVAPKVHGVTPSGARMTVRWRSEIAEVRPYNVPPPPRW